MKMEQGARIIVERWLQARPDDVLHFIIEDESAYGTFHIGFGRNLSLGGAHDAAGHFDIVIHDPTITSDGTVIMRNGAVCTNYIHGFLYL